MSIKIGDIDIFKTIIELEYQTKLNSYLIEYLMTKSSDRGLYLQNEVDELKHKAVKAINQKYDKEVLTFRES